MELKAKVHILIFIDWYLPGYGAGGPIQSISNLTQAMKEDFRFSIITRNKDHNSNIPYPNITPNQWIQRPEGVEVFYFSDDQLKKDKLLKIVDERQADWLYVNSLFSLPFTIWPLQYLQRSKVGEKLLLAPRGMLHSGALSQKKWKKKAFLSLIRLTGIHKKIFWQATDDQEIADIKKHFGEESKVFLAQNFPKQDQKAWTRVEKRVGESKMVYHSRVSPKKNLHFLLEQMGGMPGLSLDVYGPQENKAYLERCKSLVREMGLKVEFKGAVTPAELAEKVPLYHFSVLPTLGENFGHSIFEGLLAGKPVLISDQTPWRYLAPNRLGWDLRLADIGRWELTLEKMLKMNQESYDKWSQAAWEYAKNYKSSPEFKDKMKNIFLLNNR